MENKKEPLMSAEEYYDNNNTDKTTTAELMQQYANYHTQWHLNNAKEFVCSEAKAEWEGMARVWVDKQSIHTAIDNYIKINLQSSK